MGDSGEEAKREVLGERRGDAGAREADKMAAPSLRAAAGSEEGGARVVVTPSAQPTVRRKLISAVSASSREGCLKMLSGREPGSRKAAAVGSGGRLVREAPRERESDMGEKGPEAWDIFQKKERKKNMRDERQYC